MASLRWSQESGVEWQYLAPATRHKTPSSKFNGRLWDGLLNEALLISLAMPRSEADYNTVRPHGAIGDRRRPLMLRSAYQNASATIAIQACEAIVATHRYARTRGRRGAPTGDQRSKRDRHHSPR